MTRAARNGADYGRSSSVSSVFAWSMILAVLLACVVRGFVLVFASLQPQRDGGVGRFRSAHAVKNAITVQQTAASAAATDACGICVFTWSIRSQPVQTELSTVVSEMGEHWSP